MVEIFGFRNPTPPKPKRPPTDEKVVLHTDYPENPDIEALDLATGTFQGAIIAEYPYYNHGRHIANTLTKELGQAWGKRYSKTHLWEVLKAHAAEGQQVMELEEGIE